MQFELTAGVTAFVALLLAILALKLLIKGDWLLGLIKGLAGLLLVFASLFFAGIAFDIYSYQQLLAEKPIATVSFTQKANQIYLASVTEPGGEKQQYDLRGDLWQMDVRMIKWVGGLASLGLDPGYKLDRISGRYLSLEQERESSRSVYSLVESNSPLDAWALANRYLPKAFLIDASYGSATYVPMIDGALYSVSLSNSGLIARPLNAPAKEAVESWN